MPDSQSVLDGRDPNGVRYVVGPPELTGADVEGAEAREIRGWVVDIRLNDEGFHKMDALARELFGKPPPGDGIAIVLDGVVQSVPVFQAPNFGRRQRIEISSDYTEAEARGIARALNQ